MRHSLPTPYKPVNGPSVPPYASTPRPLSCRLLTQTNHLGPTQYVEQHMLLTLCCQAPECCHCCLLQGISLATTLLLLLLLSARYPLPSPHALLPLLLGEYACTHAAAAQPRRASLSTLVRGMGHDPCGVDKHCDDLSPSVAACAHCSSRTSKHYWIGQTLGSGWVLRVGCQQGGVHTRYDDSCLWGQRSAAKAAPAMSWAAAAAVMRGLSLSGGRWGWLPTDLQSLQVELVVCWKGAG